MMHVRIWAFSMDGSEAAGTRLVHSEGANAMTLTAYTFETHRMNVDDYLSKRKLTRGKTTNEPTNEKKTPRPAIWG